jgi:hypothetical protein
MKRRVALGLALVVVCAFVAVFLLAPGPAAQSRKKIRLSDGNIVTLEKVTFSIGSQHDFSFDDSSLTRFARKLPRFLRHYFPSRGRMSWNTTSNSLVLWFTMADSRTGAPLDFHSLLTAEVADEHGCSAADQSYGSMTSGTNPSIYITTFSQFPRRQPTFRVRLRSRKTSGGDPNKPLTEFDVPNPVRGPFPVWVPEALPAARTNGDLVFILKNTGNPAPGPAWRGPQFDILRGALPAGDWESDTLYVAEANGNRGLRPFCTNEPAWKLEVEFLHNEKAAFLPSEMSTVTNLTAPADGVAIPFTYAFTLQGKQFALFAIAGPGRYVYSNTVVTLVKPWVVTLAEGSDPAKGEATHSSTTYQGATPIHTYDVRRKEPHVALTVPPLAEEERLLVRVRYLDGFVRKLEPGTSTDRLRLFTLSAVTNTGPFDLDVIVHRVRRAEFMVKPPGK